MTLSGLSNDRLVGSVSGVLGGIDLDDWIAGTQYEISVTDDEDGSVTLSLPLQLTDVTHSALPGGYVSVAEALVALYGYATNASKKAVATIGAAGFAADADMAAELSAQFLPELDGDNEMIFVNGQLMLNGADYALNAVAETLAFKFALVADDVVVVQKA